MRFAVRDNSFLEAAALTHFPMRYNTGPLVVIRPDEKKTRWIFNRTAFCRYYPTMFTERVRNLVLASPLQAMGSRGFMFGNGEVWVLVLCRRDSHDCKMGIYAVNATH